MSVNLTNINKVNKKANVQYSYPVANVQNGPNKYEFSLQFNGFNQNFSASFDNTYISGVCVKATVSNKKHNLGGNAELVLEHKKSDNTPFYVVIPLVFDSENKSSLDVLFLAEEDRVLHLDSDLKKNKSVYCYKNDNNTSAYIFVFDTPVYIQQGKPSLSEFSKFTGMKSKSGFKITNAQNIEDEIVCEYETQIDENAPVADTTTLKTILLWVFILLGYMVLLVYFLTMVANKAEHDKAKYVYMLSGVVGVVLFLLFIRLFSNTETNQIKYGALVCLSIMTMLLSLIAHNRYFISS